MVEGGFAHGSEINDQPMCLWGAPSPVYKGVEEGERAGLLGAPKGGVLLSVGVGFPLP